MNGFGIPYTNGDDEELSRQVNENKPLAKGTTLLSILRQREFVFLVQRPIEYLEIDFSESSMDAPWTYPLGTKHDWKPKRFWNNHQNIQVTEPFLRAMKFDDDNTHVAVVANLNALDILWVSREADKLQKEHLRAYFVPQDPQHADPENPACYFWVIIPISKEFRMDYKGCWARLASAATCQLALGGSRNW